MGEIFCCTHHHRHGSHASNTSFFYVGQIIIAAALGYVWNGPIFLLLDAAGQKSRIYLRCQGESLTHVLGINGEVVARIQSDEGLGVLVHGHGLTASAFNLLREEAESWICAET